ncbi:MAG: RidA family protein [Clostridia bacterium]|nr:RidA family protein [Clostridia bacterium]MBQ1434742.1 RidA family protein [Clostridia bacterium]MBQ4248430.1 RidA family protein [Clostridia bacterium]
MKIIETNKAPKAIGPYSQAIEAGGFVYTSGQIPLDPETGVLKGGDIKEQTRQVIKNLDAVLSAAGVGASDVVKTMCFLQSMDDFGAFNEVYAQYFTSKPARSCVEVSKLPKGALVEIEAVAVKR